MLYIIKKYYIKVEIHAIRSKLQFGDEKCKLFNIQLMTDSKLQASYKERESISSENYGQYWSFMIASCWYELVFSLLMCILLHHRAWLPSELQQIWYINGVGWKLGQYSGLCHNGWQTLCT